MFRASLRSPIFSLRPSAAKSLTASRTIAARFLSQEARGQIQNAVKSSPVVLFMKGTPDLPECGFSRAAVQVLDLHRVPPEKMKTYNVLTDDELRSGIKEFSDWPTIPQLYVNGEFVGGCDILLGMHQSGELEDLLVTNDIIPKVEEHAEAQVSTA
ncbi:thioredoxin-like protein [Lentinula aciculospora]|uniref:Monothiol glutaredoxin-5, mitochondrial n=1 Tax=Lentinula aciculospora TaxID=153920 RepID=A0A9W8ZYD3_9AGAR|nr:thioredoxin-like protein [Lentinula aciculospora]